MKISKKYSRLWVSVPALLLMVLSFVPVFMPHASAADATELRLTLKGYTSSALQIQAIRQNPPANSKVKSYTFTRKSSTSYVISTYYSKDYLQSGESNPCEPSGDTPKYFDYYLKASENDKPVALTGDDTTFTWGCKNQNGTNDLTVTAKAPDAKTVQNGSFSGTIYITNGSTPAKEPALLADGVAHLTGPNNFSKDIPVANNGTFKYANIPPGTYSLSGVVTTQQHQDRTEFKHDSITIKPGAETKLDVIVDSNNPDGNAEAGKANITCESEGGALGWIMCPIIEGLAKAIDGIYDNLIQPLLQTNAIVLTPGDETHIYEIWSNFRILGDIFLVIALLVIVFGESIGGGLIDAYAAKKILPRLLVAAIAINLSIYVVALAVDITNIVGNGIAQLLTAPFKEVDQGFSLKPNAGAQGIGLAALVGGSVWAIASGAALLEFLFAFLLLPGIFLFIAIMGVVILRRGLIIFLTIISPVAFALYCLPNTEKYFKQWWELLVKTLLVYPLIAVIFAIAKIMSVTISSGTTGTGFTPTIAGVLSMIVLFVPLFLIPFAFKLAGGILGKVQDLASGASKRAHQGILGNPNNQDSWRNRSKNKLLARNAENNLSARGIGATLNPRTAFKPSQRKARQAAVRNMWQSHYGAQGVAAKAYEHYKDDSNVMGDLALYGSGAKSREAIEDQIAEHTRSGGQRGFARGSAEHQRALFSSAAADQIGRNPFMRRQALMNPVTSGYALKQGEDGWKQATGVMREIAGDDEGTYAALMNQFQAVAKGPGGRTDLSAAVDGGEYNGYRAWTQLGMYQHGNGKPTAIKGSAEYFNGLWDRASSGPQAMTQQDISNFTAHLSEGQKASMTESQLRTTAQSRAMDAVGIFSKELDNMGDSATGGVRDEAVRQSAALKARGGSTLAAVRDSDEVKRAARGYDREEMARRQASGTI